VRELFFLKKNPKKKMMIHNSTIVATSELGIGDKVVQKVTEVQNIIYVIYYIGYSIYYVIEWIGIIYNMTFNDIALYASVHPFITLTTWIGITSLCIVLLLACLAGLKKLLFSIAFMLLSTLIGFLFISGVNNILL